MSATRVRGAPLAARIREQTAAAVTSRPRPPVLVNVVVGETGASSAYLDSLDRAARRVGIDSRRVVLDADVRQAALMETVAGLGADEGVDGLMIQRPLPPGIDSEPVVEAIPAAKDVDGQTRASLGAVLAGRPRHTAPATAAAVVEILASAPELRAAGRSVAVVGRSLVVGRPLAAMLVARGEDGDATVTVCHTATPDLGEVTRRADVVVAAAGRLHLLTPDMVRPGAVVVDVGTHVIEDDDGTRLAGDVHPDVGDVAGALTPVPGGVGPVTTAVLMRHVAAAARPGALDPAW